MIVVLQKQRPSEGFHVCMLTKKIFLYLYKANINILFENSRILCSKYIKERADNVTPKKNTSFK